MLSGGLTGSGTRGLFSIMEGRRSEDRGFSVGICSSIDGQRCYAVSLVEHGGGLGEYGDFGDAVSSGDRCLQVEQVSIGQCRRNDCDVAGLVNVANCGR